MVQEIFSDQSCDSRDVTDDGIISALKICLSERTDCQKKLTVCI